MVQPRTRDSLSQWHELVGMPGQNDAKSARRVELARELTRGAERQVLFVMPVRADRAGIDAAMPGVDRDDAQRLRPRRRAGSALRGGLGGTQGPAAESRRNGA